MYNLKVSTPTLIQTTDGVHRIKKVIWDVPKCEFVKWILHYFQFTVGQFRGVCGGIGWSVGECFGINKTDFSRWLWKDADEVLVRLFRVSATYPLVWNIWMTSSTSGSGEGTRSGLIDIIPINSIIMTKLQLNSTLSGQIKQRSIRRS
jgi:hypothetical protein